MLSCSALSAKIVTSMIKKLRSSGYSTSNSFPINTPCYLYKSSAKLSIMFVKHTGKNSTMMRLLIILSLLAIGKIHGQEVFIPQLINVQFLSPQAQLYSDHHRRPIIITPDQNWQIDTIQTARSQNPMQRAAYTARFPSTQSDSGFNLHLQAAKEDTPKRSFSTQTLEKMSQPSESPSNASAGNTRRNNSDVISKENDPKPVFKSKPSQVTSTNEKPIVLPPMDVTGVNPATNETSQSVNKNGTKVTVDERSSFDGDNCPTGYVKVNGKCVEAD